jgi:hypothetical protein
MAKSRTLKVLAGVVVSFIGLAGAIIFLAATEKIRFGMAMLMLAALVGFYIGFGVLIAVYRLINKLD